MAKKRTDAKSKARTSPVVATDGERMVDARKVADQAATLPIKLRSMGGDDKAWRRMAWDDARDAVASILRHFEGLGPAQIQAASLLTESTHSLRQLDECLAELWTERPGLEHEQPRHLGKAELEALRRAADRIERIVADLESSEARETKRPTVNEKLVDPQPELPWLGAEFSPLESDVVRFLWNRGVTSIDDLRKHVWRGKRTSDEAIYKVCRNAQRQLMRYAPSELDVSMKASRGRGWELKHS